MSRGIAIIEAIGHVLGVPIRFLAAVFRVSLLAASIATAAWMASVSVAALVAAAHSAHTTALWRGGWCGMLAALFYAWMAALLWRLRREAGVTTRPQ